jgi:hypothetical protein
MGKHKPKGDVAYKPVNYKRGKNIIDIAKYDNNISGKHI